MRYSEQGPAMEKEDQMTRIKSGKILIYRLCDVALEIDLSGVEERLREEANPLNRARPRIALDSPARPSFLTEDHR